MGAQPFIITLTDGNGGAASGAKCYAYQKNTTTPQNVFTDSGLSTAAANPAIADADGKLELYLNDAQNYTLRIKDSAEALTLFEVDYVGGSDSFIVIRESPTDLTDAQLADISALADIIPDIQAVEDIDAEVVVVANIAADVSTVAANAGDIAALVDDQGYINLAYDGWATATAAARRTIFRDGVTSAIAAGKPLYVPPGSWTVNVDAGGLVPSGTTGTLKIVGSGSANTTLTIERTATGYAVAMSLTDLSVEFEGITIKQTVPANQTNVVALLNDGASFIMGHDTAYDGQTTEITGARSHVAYLTQISESASAVIEKIVYRDLYAKAASGLMLMANTSQATIRHIHFDYLFTENMYMVDLLFNAPNGAINRVTGNTFVSLDNLGSTVGQFTHRYSAAGDAIGPITIANMMLLGTGTGFRSEEGAGPQTIGNLIVINSGDKDGFEVTGNNVGGGELIISDIYIGNAYLEHVGSPTNARGVHIVSAATSDYAERICFGTLRVKNYAKGVTIPGSVGFGSPTVSWAKAIISDCAIGVSAYRFAGGFGDTVIENCTTPIETTWGGLIDNIRLVDCGDDPLVLKTNAGARLTLTGLTIIRTDVVLGASTTTSVPILEDPANMLGDLAVNISESNAVSNGLVTIDYDGSTMTDARTRHLTSGSVNISSNPLSIASDVISLDLFNAGAEVTIEELVTQFKGYLVY